MSRHKAYRAFLKADRLCRDYACSRAQDLLLRASCLRALGEDIDALRDLDAAADLGAADLDVQRSILDWHPGEQQRGEAARAILAHPRATRGDEANALETLLRTERLVLHLSRTKAGVSGLVAWAAGPTPELVASGNGDGTPVALEMEQPWAAPNAGPKLATFRREIPGSESLRVSARHDGETYDAISLPISGAPLRLAPATAGVLSVVVPVYGGLEVTRACLEALASQQCRAVLDIVIVDDASPDLALAAFAERICRARGWRHLRNSVNRGFAATVNAGLALGRGTHLLILNADAILPRDALDRLLDAAGQPDVGTVVPFSNDGGFTSFPRMRMKNPVPAPEDARKLDQTARVANAGQIVDIPSGTAFCMVLTRACLEAVGGLDLGYGRGYFEDVDLCLRAARHGFRNVVATAVYVAHVGSQSFGADKRALAAVNAERIRERFPDYEIAWASFVEADPLAAARAAIERSVPPAGPVRLVAGRRARLSTLLDRIAEEAGTASGVRVLELGWNRNCDVTIEASDGEIPQNLVFASHERAALADYLRRLDVQGVEIAEPDVVPAPLLDALRATGAPFRTWVADRAAVDSLRGERASWPTGLAVVPIDSMTQAALEPVARPSSPEAGRRMAEGRRPAARGSLGGGSEGAVIGVLLPSTNVGALSTISALAARWARTRSEPIIVFGGGLDAPLTLATGAMHFTGPMTPSDYPAAVRHHRISHLLLPYRDRYLRFLEDLVAVQARPAAYFDWSGGAHHQHPADLALAATMNDVDAAERIVRWTGDSPLVGRSSRTVRP